MNRILILDYGSQFTQLIARRIREASVYCEIHPASRGTDLAFIRESGPDSNGLFVRHALPFDRGSLGSDDHTVRAAGRPPGPPAAHGTAGVALLQGFRNVRCFPARVPGKP